MPGFADDPAKNAFSESEIDAFYREQSELFAPADEIWEHFEWWCAERHLDPTDALSFELYLAKERPGRGTDALRATDSIAPPP